MLRWFVEDLATVAALMLVVAMIATWAEMLGGWKDQNNLIKIGDERWNLGSLNASSSSLVIRQAWALRNAYRTIRGTMNNAPRHKSKARANVHRHGSNYSLTTTASSARILWCLHASTNRWRLRRCARRIRSHFSTHPAAAWAHHDIGRGVFRTKSLKSVCSSAALANDEQVVKSSHYLPTDPRQCDMLLCAVPARGDLAICRRYGRVTSWFCHDTPSFRCSRHSPRVPRQSRPRADHARVLELDASSRGALRWSLQAQEPQPSGPPRRRADGGPHWSALAWWRAMAAELSTRELWGWTAANNETREYSPVSAACGGWLT